MAEGLYKERNVTFPAHPVLLMSDDWGTNRCVKINSSGLAAFFLGDEQDNRTVIRGLNINLLGSPVRQFGFYLGRGHTTFAGASPFFDGVKVQLGTADWSAGFYGFGSAEGIVRFNNCIVRGAGENNTLSGIYLVDAPDVQVVNCSFLNFNSSANLSQGILLGTSSINLGHAASSINAQISNCFWDDSFASNNNYAVVHALDSSSRYQTTVSRSVVPYSSRLLNVDSEVSVIEAFGTALQDGLILSNSPCLNVSGADLLSWHDFHGQVRAGSPDVGADEYSAITTNDTDHDGLSDYSEAFTYETFIFDSDSDDDGVGDGAEVTCGTDPQSRTNYCVTIMGTVNDQTGLNASIKASYALGSSAWNSSNAVSLSSGQFSYPHQVINSAQSIVVQVLIDLNGNGSLDSDEPYYTRALHITNHTTEIEFKLKDADGDGIDDYDENSCGTDPNAASEYCVTLQGTVTNQTTLPGKMFATAILREETLPPMPWDMDDEDYQSIALAQVEIATNGTFALNHVVVQPNTNGLNKLWVVVYQDTLTNNVVDYFEPITQVLVTPTNHTMNYQVSAPEGVCDGDRDNIPDWWEAWHGLSYTNILDGFADFDGDWIDNLWEYRLDLDPNVYNTNNYAFADAMHAVDSRIEGLSPTNAIHIFSENYWVSTNLTRNPNCWAADIDLTCCSPWNSYFKNKMAGTLITPRHVLFAAHYDWMPTNTTLRFIDKQNNVIERALIAKKQHPDYTPWYPDFTVGLLDADVPSNAICFAKVLPTNYTNYIGSGEHIPALALDQEEKALVTSVFDPAAVTLDHYSNVYHYAEFVYPLTSIQLLYSEPLGGGDSGNPAFMILNEEPVLLTVWTYGSSGRGTSISAFKDDINQMMSDLDTQCGVTNGYQLTEIDLSFFDEF